ncbi:unnamed protein product (macronuclear) [Paramecium tetraurelia]|uniref:Transmembrane protein n=1 Tax=Paramecium tetraurelia TaxID=5888 RepID=A0ED71_PARTE|nr:uncharacterized protein GSPATT00004107001 [Paramecium tetraurelia]CAK93238.1 unnamed protein product [Paramecium tetraurelia]|eukprot:XP_001460635.1 hypothetical protein (macronuclear) [Paramecium tetraurelia strain d4-2]
MLLYIFQLSLLLSLRGIKIRELDSSYQVSKQSIKLSENDFTITNGFRYGLWSKYNPLTNIPQVGIVGQFDSNCLFLHSTSEQYTESLNLLYYECLNYEQKKITKIIAFIDNNEEQHLFSKDIDFFDYENAWYFLMIVQWPLQQKFELILMYQQQTILHSYLQIKWPFYDNNILLTFGGSMIVGQSKISFIEQGTKISYFPGKIVLYEFEIVDISFSENYQQIQQAFFELYQNCLCQDNYQSDIGNVDISQLDNLVFVSENINCNSFILSGWMKIIEIVKSSEEFIYQLLFLASNFQNSLADYNLAPFSLSYKISSVGNQIIVTTYSYTFPQVTIDFSDNPFLIKKEFDISNSIFLWHQVYVQVKDDQLTIQIQFLEGHQVYDYIFQIKVFQFKQTQFKLQYGNNLQSQTNYLNIQLRNFKFYNCYIQVNQQNCHYTCEDCEGPNKNNCLSCKKGSDRIYLAQFKACVCPYNTIDDQDCQSYYDHNLEIVNNAEKKQSCQYGYFEYSDSCYQCPSIIQENLVTCLECVQNPKGWIQDPKCDRNLYLNLNGSVEKIFTDQSPIYFHFDGNDAIYCKNCNKTQSFVQNEYNIEESEIQLLSLDYFCLGLLQNCLKCLYTLFGNTCLECYFGYISIEGVCTSLSQDRLEYCIPPLYLTLRRQCEVCNIKFCKYCFQYVKNDIRISTLYRGFEFLEQDQEIITGCALCEENYIYDFDKQLCFYQHPQLQNCQRSFVKDNKEICTLSMIDDFKLASEIMNCQKYQLNCLQCILTLESTVKCVVCDVGYTASMKNGGCYLTDPITIVGAKIVIEGSYSLQDGWIQRIQSFITKFLPNQYFYPQSQLITDMQEQIVECLDGFKLIEFICRKYCDSDCLSCDYNYHEGFICNHCPLNYYYQPIRDQIDGSCSECPYLCQACQIRSKNEIYVIYLYYQLDFLTQFLIEQRQSAVSDPNIQLDLDKQIARYCFDEQCSSTFLHEVSYDYCELIDSFWELSFKINYLNQIGIDTLIIKFIFTSQIPCKVAIIWLDSTVQTKIFSLNSVQYIITSEIDLIFSTSAPIYILNVDTLVISNIVQKRIANDDFVILNNSTQTDLKLFNFTINDSNIQNSKSLFQIETFGQVELNNVTILNSILVNSSFLSLSNSQINGIIKIDRLIIKGCTLTNSKLFQLTDNKIILQVRNLLIEDCKFQNSSIFFIKTSLDQLSKITFQDVTIKASQFNISSLVNCFNYAILSMIDIKLYSNELHTSSFITQNYNFSIQYLSFLDNNIYESQLISIIEEDFNQKISINIINFVTKQIQIKNSNLLRIYSDQESSNIILKIQNLNFEEMKSQYSSDFSSFLFIIKCLQFTSSEIKIHNLNNIFIFYIYESNAILIQNIIYEQQDQQYKVQLSQNCKSQMMNKNKLMKVVDFSSFKLTHVQIVNQFTIDESILELSPKQLQLVSINIKIEIIDIIFRGNLQLHQQSSRFFSLLSIDSERIIDITICNIQFLENIFHSQTDDTLFAYSSQIYINSQRSSVEIFNLSSSLNALTNSSNSFIYINSFSLMFHNHSVSHHNILSSDILQKYYDIELESFMDQEQINSFISQILFIKNIGGAAKIIASNFTCENCQFQHILAFKSVIFEIITQFQGSVRLMNIAASNLQSDLNQITNSSGCISIYSQNSLLDLEILNSTFYDILNRMSSSILTIQSSNIQNTIYLQNIQIQNCLSLIHQILQIEVSKKIIQNNKVFLKNIKVSQDEEAWQHYFTKVRVLSRAELLGVSSSDNALIYIESCSASLKSITFEGFYISSILIFVNSPILELQDLLLTQIQSFYSFTLVKIIQQAESESKMILQQLRITNQTNYLVNDISIQFSNEIFQSIGCNQFQMYSSTNMINYSISELFQTIQRQAQKQASLIYISISSNKSSLYFNQVHLFKNNCTLCSDGLISFDLDLFQIVKIQDFHCHYNFAQEYGCLKFTTSNELSHVIHLQNSNFIQNVGSRGIAISSLQLPINIKSCKMILNTAKYEGGAIYFDMKSNIFSVKHSFIISNKATEGGGIYLKQNINLNLENSIKNYLIFNKASIQGDNIVEYPTHLALFINSFEMPSQILNFEQFQTKILNIKPYSTIEQEKKIITKYFMIPSNQAIAEFSLILPRLSQTILQISKLALNFKNSLNELILNSLNSSCAVLSYIVMLNETKEKKFLKSDILAFDINQTGFDLTSLTFQLDPYNQDYKYLEIQISCEAGKQQNYLHYYIQSKSYKCQLGEFYVDFGCQKCQPIQRFYSVTYDSIKCSIFDKEKFLEITSNAIQLKNGYWRPNYLSDFSALCFKNLDNCGGGWRVGDDSCSEGHVGALCEECDIYNVRGFGKHFKIQSKTDCVKCFGIQDSILPVFFNILWTILSIVITLRSIQKSNELFLYLKIRERFSRILFKLNQDLQSIFVKMFLNYLWIFSVILTFNINFQISFDFINQASNTSYSLANNLDCYLSEIEKIELIYFKVIVILVLILLQFCIIIIGYFLFSIATKNEFKLSIVSNTLLCLYIFNFAGIINILCSLISVREISHLQYIQGDLTRLFYTQSHRLWILYLVFPGLMIFGFIIPLLLFLLMYFKRNFLNKSKLRPHICYLFNEYQSTRYYWEQIKLSKKAVIILFLTYFETRITLKASLIGLTLLYYQKLAFQKKPYTLSNLNRLDSKAGYICSFSIPLAAIKYENETESNNSQSIVLQITLIALPLMLSYQFTYNITLIHIIKYKFVGGAYLFLMSQYMNLEKSSNKSQGLLNQYSRRKQRLQQNLEKLRKYLLQVSKNQIKNRSQILNKTLGLKIQFILHQLIHRDPLVLSDLMHYILFYNYWGVLYYIFYKLILFQNQTLSLCSYFCLSYCFFQIKKVEKALNHHIQALNQCSFYPQVLIGLYGNLCFFIILTNAQTNFKFVKCREFNLEALQKTQIINTNLVNQIIIIVVIQQGENHIQFPLEASIKLNNYKLFKEIQKNQRQKIVQQNKEHMIIVCSYFSLERLKKRKQIGTINYTKRFTYIIIQVSVYFYQYISFLCQFIIVKVTTLQLVIFDAMHYSIARIKIENRIILWR